MRGHTPCKGGLHAKALHYNLIVARLGNKSRTGSHSSKDASTDVTELGVLKFINK